MKVLFEKFLFNLCKKYKIQMMRELIDLEMITKFKNQNKIVLQMTISLFTKW
jgi:hypothetical protein